MTTLEQKLATAALADPDLTALLGAGTMLDPFRWWGSRLVQGSAFPAVVVLLVGSNDMYVLDRRLPGGFCRVQFTIWDTDPQRVRAVDQAVTCFLNTFDALGLPGLKQYPNYVVSRVARLYPLPEPPRYQRILDVKIFDNEKV